MTRHLPKSCRLEKTLKLLCILVEDGQFVEMAELLPDHLSSSHYAEEDQSKSTKIKYKEVLNIIEWLQCFSLYIAMIVHSNASHVVDLLGYQT